MAQVGFLNLLSKILSMRVKEIEKLTPPNKICYTKSLYLQATNDKLINQNSFESLKKVIPNIEKYQIKGSHLLLQTNPKNCVEVIITHINSLKPPHR